MFGDRTRRHLLGKTGIAGRATLGKPRSGA